MTIPSLPPSSITTSIADFRAAMDAAGIHITGDIVADGTIHRYHVKGDRSRSRNAWAVLHLDRMPAGCFGDHKRGIRVKWSAKGAVRMSREERRALAERIKADRERREAEERRRQDAAAELANRIWDAAKPSGHFHPYLVSKAVMGDGLRKTTWVKDFVDESTGEASTVRVPNALLVPILDAKDSIISLQAIFPNAKNALGRQKDFLKNGRKAGGYFRIGSPTQVRGSTVIVIAEGYATGASINLCSGFCVMVAFDAGNLRSVAERVREELPDALIVIAADDDRWTTTPVNNPGVHHATAAAQAVGGVVAIPTFPGDSPIERPTDWNDLQAIAGGDEVKRQLMAAINSGIGGSNA